jgi:hypothetical protein
MAVVRGLALKVNAGKERCWVQELAWEENGKLTDETSRVVGWCDQPPVIAPVSVSTTDRCSWKGGAAISGRVVVAVVQSSEGQSRAIVFESATIRPPDSGLLLRAVPIVVPQTPAAWGRELVSEVAVTATRRWPRDRVAVKDQLIKKRGQRASAQAPPWMTSPLYPACRMGK